MIDKKFAIVTIHDVNPSCEERMKTVTSNLDKIGIKYNISIVPDYENRNNLKDNILFCNQINSILHSGKVELSLHGLYHQKDGKIEDFDSESKEKEKEKIEKALDIFSSVNLPHPSVFIPPAWKLSRQAIEALKELKFEISEAMSNIEFITKKRKYLLSPVMNWDKYGDKEKNKETLEQNKKEFYVHLFNINGESYGLFRMAIHPPYDPNEALADQIKMIEFLKEKENYEFVKYSDLINELPKIKAA